MQSKLKETFIINLIIIVMLCVIGGYSQKESVAVLSDFDDKDTINDEIENYNKIVHIEALTLSEMIRRDVMPAISAYESRLAHTIGEKRAVSQAIDCSVEAENLTLLSTASRHLLEQVNALDAAVDEAQKTDGLFECAKLYHDKVLYIMNKCILALLVLAINFERKNQMAGYKNGRITSDIHRELSALLRELKDPRISPLISIVKVDVSGDLSSCKVYVSAFSGVEETAASVKGLKNAAGF